MHSHALSTAKEVGLNGATAQKPVALEHGLDYIPSNVKELMVVLHAQQSYWRSSRAVSSHAQLIVSGTGVCGAVVQRVVMVAHSHAHTLCRHRQRAAELCVRQTHLRSSGAMNFHARANREFVEAGGQVKYVALRSPMVLRLRSKRTFALVLQLEL